MTQNTAICTSVQNEHDKCENAYNRFNSVNKHLWCQVVSPHDPNEFTEGVPLNKHNGVLAWQTKGLLL